MGDVTPVLVLAGVLGLLVGSFLNVVIWRVPRGESVVSPPSACPACEHRIRPWDNVPVVSWLALRGRCRDCGAAISARYVLVESATGVLFVLTVVRFGVAWETLAFGYLAAVGLALALIDLDVHRLPDALVLPSYPVVGVVLVIASLAPGGTTGPGALLRGLVGAVGLFTLYFALMVLRPGGMGFGDVKLAGVLGGALAWLGWGSWVVGAFAAFLLGGIFSLGLLVSRRAGRRSAIPFGPWMVLGAAVGAAWGEALWGAYLGVLA
ncbi:prepilin peptidase [Actinotalea lenta]|uniref:prepilin peptidase n=1 Tax=Actinotalea lenta TaxID=3064654 RepID=UPI003312FD33